MTKLTGYTDPGPTLEQWATWTELVNRGSRNPSAGNVDHLRARRSSCLTEWDAPACVAGVDPFVGDRDTDRFYLPPVKPSVRLPPLRSPVVLEAPDNDEPPTHKFQFALERSSGRTLAACICGWIEPPTDEVGLYFRAYRNHLVTASSEQVA